MTSTELMTGRRRHCFSATRTIHTKLPKRDIMWAQSVGASIICGDDYDLASEPGVKRAVDELGGPRQLADGLFVL